MGVRWRPEPQPAGSHHEGRQRRTPLRRRSWQRRADGEGDNNDTASTNTNYPSSYTNPNIVSVAASDNTDALASFSNFGASTVDLAAPGVNVLSTLPGNRYGYYSGTSMPTPHVAGVAALIKSQQPTLDDAQLKTRILEGVDASGNLSGKVLTGGRLNAANALPASTTADQAADTTDPTVTRVGPTRTYDRTPRVAATVSDDRTELTRGDIAFALDGVNRGRFAYNTGTDRLTFESGQLPLGRHTVRITATDEASNRHVTTWTFKIVRR